LTSFEKAFFLYQKRLNERLALPFTRYFYIKKDTPADVEWKRKAAVRQTAARDVGIYNAYSEEGWNDEVLTGSKLSEPEDIVEKLIRDAEGKDIIDAEPVGDAETAGRTVSGKESSGESLRKPVGEVSIDRPLARTTKDDEQNNTKSLNRRLDRNLYLLVKNKEGVWRFPQDRIYAREGLHQVRDANAMFDQRQLTFIVGRRTSASPSGRYQHEHMGCWQPPYRPLHR
jgi:large subunit ribosomal protein L46